MGDETGGTKTEESIRAVERWFVRHGIPHFIHNYSAREDVLTRAVPLLGFVFLVQTLTAFDFGWPLWQNALVSIGGLSLGIGAWLGLNRVRGRRLWARPDRVGMPEVTFFVFAPSLVYVVFGFRWRAALVAVAANLILIGVIYLVTSYGVVPMTRWAIGRVFRELGSVLGLLMRALPYLLLFTVFLFINTEVWQVGDALTQPSAWAVAGLFVLLGLLFLVSRLPRELREITHIDTWSGLESEVAGTPASALAAALGPLDGPVEAFPLTRREAGNVGLVIVWVHVLQILFVALLLGAFFVLFGLLIITPRIIESWVGSPPECATFLNWTILCNRRSGLLLSKELLRVAGFLAAFSGLYFTVYVVTDQNFRAEFFEDLLGEIRQAVDVRAVYRRFVAEGAAGTLAASEPAREQGA